MIGFSSCLAMTIKNENENREDVIFVLICEKQSHEVLKSDNSRLMQRLFFVMVSLMGGAETKGGAIRCGGEDWLAFSRLHGL